MELNGTYIRGVGRVVYAGLPLFPFCRVFWGQCMDGVLELKEIYSRVVDGFGVNHARIMHLLLDNLPREASQIMHELSLDRGYGYLVIKQLVDLKLVKETNSSPKKYAAEETRKTFHDLVRQKTLSLMEDRLRLQQIIEQRGQAIEEEFTVAFGNQTRLLVNTKTKEVKQLEEKDAKWLKNNINSLIREKEKKEWMTTYNK